jgi:3-deoxy-7-phosphoheptulonate synthase
MIVEMNQDATADQIGEISKSIEAEGFRAQVMRVNGHSNIGIIGKPQEEMARKLEKIPGVKQVIPEHEPFTSRAFRAEDTIIRVKKAVIGEGTFTIMAGPCAVETADQVMKAARHVVAQGGTVLRGGAFKPRTSPYSFQGLGEEGLKYLKAAGDETGLAIVTEAMGPAEVELVARYADIVQIGSRNVQNFRLLEAAGRQDKPVLLKRGMMSTIDEYLQAAEYIMSCGNPNVILCERGIRTFEKQTRNTLDISAVPVIKKLSHLPVIIDPSHATGVREYVSPLARAAVAVGADGILVEVHPDPDQALCDGDQSLKLDEFTTLVRQIKGLAREMGKEL